MVQGSSGMTGFQVLILILAFLAMVYGNGFNTFFFSWESALADRVRHIY